MRTLILILFPLLLAGQNLSVLAKAGGTLAGITEDGLRASPTGAVALFNQFDGSLSIINATAGHLDGSAFYGLGYGHMITRRASVHFTVLAFPHKATGDVRHGLPTGGELSGYWRAWQRQGVSLLVTASHGLTNETVYFNIGFGIKYNLYESCNCED